MGVYKHTGNVDDYTNFKEALATTEIRKSKRTFEKKLAGAIKNDSENVYAYVRSKQNVRDKVGPLEKKKVETDGFQMAEVVNKYFSSVSPQQISAHFQIQLLNLRAINQII